MRTSGDTTRPNGPCDLLGRVTLTDVGHTNTLLKVKDQVLLGQTGLFGYYVILLGPSSLTWKWKRTPGKTMVPLP